jgi:hypothetical protein
MDFSNKKHEAFENFAKEIGVTFSTELQDLSNEERTLIQEFALRIRDMSRISDSFLSPGEKFRRLAEKYGLSVDEGDIELFLAVELSHFLDEINITKKVLSTDAALRNQAAVRALNRVFTGIQFTGISEAHQKALWESAAEAASEILDCFKPSILKNPNVNILRKDLMDIYERFLLWMRVVRDGLLSLSKHEQNRLETQFKKMIELLNLAYMLNEPSSLSDPLVQRLIASSDARIEGLVIYIKALKELETIMPSHKKTKNRC